MAQPHFDIISIGDATIDTFIEIESATVTCSLDKESCKLCLDYAEKIPIHQLVKKVAGNAANNAVGSARLGMRAAFWTILGSDDSAKRIRHVIAKEGVSCKYVQIQRGSESNYTVVLNYQGERTQLVFRQPREYRLPKLAPASWVYLTAMGEKHHVAYADLLRYIVDNAVKLAYNPGKEQIDCDLKNCMNLFRFTDVLFVNKEEARMLLGASVNTRITNLLHRLKELGPKMVVITDGGRGSYACNGDGMFQCDIFPGPLVERTGAGDSFATGTIAALHNGLPLHEAIVWGTFNAWSVVQHIGPHDGLLTLKHIKKLWKQNPRFRAKKLL